MSFYKVSCHAYDIKKIYYLGYKPSKEQIIKLCKRHAVFLDDFGDGLEPDINAWKIEYKRIQFQDI